MAIEFEARCGIKCDECEYREPLNCPGCMKAGSKMFWGDCSVAKCCMSKELAHCGKCSDFICDKLHEFAYQPEHGDDGKRIENLRKRNLNE